MPAVACLYAARDRVAANLWPACRGGVRSLLALLRSYLAGCWPIGRRQPRSRPRGQVTRLSITKAKPRAGALWPTTQQNGPPSWLYPSWPTPLTRVPTLPSRTEPAAEAEARGGGGSRTRAGSAPPAGPAAEPSGAAAAAGRRQRRPSSRTLSAQEAKAEAVEAVERTSRRRGRQQRQAHWERGDGSLFGAAADEAWEDHEMGEQPHEDPDWRPGQGQQRAGSAPVPKRSRHSAATAR